MSNYYLPEFDFMGNPRIFNGLSEIIDIGAYEYQGESTVTARPVLSLDSGFYQGAQEVEISCVTPNAHIYFTTDGSIPSQSTIYEIWFKERSRDV